MPQDLLLIDANSIGYAAMYQPALSRLAFNGEPTSALHGLPASVFKLMRLYPMAMPVLLWDGHCQWRYDLHPDYKSNRGLDPAKLAIRESYRRQSAPLRLLLMAVGLPSISHRDVEADDIAGLLCRNLPRDTRVVLATADSDYVQAIADNVVWHDTRNDRVVDLTYLATEGLGKDGTFDSAEQYLAAKCLAGDSSDVIDGIRGIGLNTAAKFHREYGGFEALWAAADAGAPMRGAKLLSVVNQAARDTYARNRKLMDWRLAEMPDDLHYTMWRPDTQEAAAIAAEYGLAQFKKTLDSMVLPQDAWRDRLTQVEWALEGRRQ